MGKNQNAYKIGKAQLMAHIDPLYDQLTDEQDQVAFTLGVTGRGGPDIPSSNSKLQYGDFMSAEQFNKYATLPYYPETNTFGGYPRGASAMPIPQFNALLHEVPVEGY